MKNNILKLVKLYGLMVFALIACSEDVEHEKQPEYPVETFTLVKAPASLLLKSLERYSNGNATVTGQVQGLISDAGQLLNNSSQSVTEKTFMPPSGDKHDYYSMGPYWWPNPDTEDGLPYIRKDGEVNPESRDGTFDFVRFKETCFDIYTLAMAYWFSKDEMYRVKALELINVWFINESTRMNPNLKYGQAIPGVTDGRPAGIIETTQLFNVVDGYFLLEYHEPLDQDLTQNLKNWFCEYRNWLLTHEIGIAEQQTTSNHGTWYDAQISAFGILADDNDEVKQYIETYSLTRLASHVMSDGTQPEEIGRTKSLNYSLMNMRAHIRTANMAASLGVDMFNYQDEPIKLALEYIIKNLPPKGEWPHTQIQDISSSHYNDLAQMIILYNHNTLTLEDIQGANDLAIDLYNWGWLIFGGKP